MNHRDELKAFLDGELPADRHAEMEAALATHAELRHEAETLRTLAAEIAALARQPEPTGRERVLAALDRRPLSWRPVWAVCIAVLATVLIAPPLLLNRPLDSDYAAGVMSAYAGNDGYVEVAPSRGNVEMGMPMGEVPGVEMGLPSQHVVHTGNLTLALEDVPRAFEQVQSLAVSLGGRLEHGSVSGVTGRQRADATIRVPVGRFGEARERLLALGRSVEESIRTEDVTGQVFDLEARSRALRAEEEQIVELMRRASNLTETLTVRDRLVRLRQEIESLESQSQMLRSQAAYSTWHVTLMPETTARPTSGVDATWGQARRAFSRLLQQLLQAGIYVVVFAPVWIPLALLIGWLLKRWRL